MRIFLTIAALVTCLLPRAAAGDLPDEHPEWFGYTAPLDVDGPIGWAERMGRVLIAPSVGDTYHAALLGALGPGPHVTVLARGGQNQLDLYSWMEEQGLAPATLGWADIEAIDTPYVGEWGPIALQAATEEVFLLDGRYFSLRPADDAAPGRFAEVTGAPLHRIPLFLSGAHLQGTPDGLCLVGPELYNMNVGHTAAEIDYALGVYAGCTVIVPVPSPSEDLKKKPMDLYVRLTGAKASGDDGAWGVFLGDASSWSLSLQEGQDAVRGVLDAVGGGGVLVTVDVPWPESQDGAVRSYLPFVALDGAVVVPTYMGMPTIEEDMFSILGQELGEIEVRTVPSDLAAALETWPSLLVGGGAGGAWIDVPAPELLCERGDPVDCGQCLHECDVAWANCADGADGPTLSGCMTGADACLDLFSDPCPEGQICEDGACADPPTTCDTLPPGGICEDNVVVKCVAGQVVEIDCSQEFELCGYQEDGDARCFSPCEGGCQVQGETACSDASTEVLLTCTVGPEGCPEWVESLCPDAHQCLDGACVPTVVEPGEDAKDGGGVVDTGGDGPSVNAGFSGKDGCGAGPRPSGTLELLFLLGMALLLRRPLYKPRSLP